MVEETRIFLLDLNPASGLGCTLREILEVNVTPSVYLREETPASSGFDAFLPEFSALVLHFNPSVIFLALPPTYLKQARKLIQSLRGKPIIAVFEGFHPEEMVELLQLGVSDFVVPPLKAVDILPRVWRLLEQRPSGEALVRTLKEKIGLKQLVGESPSLRTELEKIPAIAKCDVSVLISGETGTGKELFARAIHYLSPRASKPFIPTSCGAIPLELVENELFGHVQGAFTSAHASQPGLIHESQGGTLFLDEVDCLPFPAQVKLLRLLQEKEYRQLGSSKIHQADIRIVAATNMELEKAVKEGNFRRDLYYRLNIIPVTLPPLRDRNEDVVLLARHFLAKYGAEFERPILDLTPDALHKLMTYDWPGNVRELENVIERAVVFCKESQLHDHDIVLPRQEVLAAQTSFQEAKSKAVAGFEKKFIEDLLLAYEGNITKSARAAGKNRRAFWELIRKHKIDVKSYRSTLVDERGHLDAEG